MKQLQLPVYNLKGEKITDTTLDQSVFGADENPQLVHQALVAFLSNGRAVIANTKDRSAVSGTGKKPWRQKGTGNARVGSARSPLWRGGGITFGPTNLRNFSVRLPLKMRHGAWRSLLSAKVANNQVVILDSINGLNGKTKEWNQAMTTLKTTTPAITNGALIVSANYEAKADQSIRNSANHKYVGVSDCTIYDMTRYPLLVLTQDAVDALTKRLAVAEKVKA